MTHPTVTAFADSPDSGRGLARDMAVRWALEEVGQPYDVRLRTMAELKQPEHRRIQPFGQIPAFEDGGLTLFESGAIVLHLAEQHPGLLPSDRDARARAITWIFAALTTLQMPIVEREAALILERDKPWFAERDAMLARRVTGRLTDLSARLGDLPWLEGEFTAGDLLMINVLRRPAGRALLDGLPNLTAYVARGEARPAFQRAFAAQKAAFDSTHTEEP